MAGLLGTASSGVSSQAGAGPGMTGLGAPGQGKVRRGAARHAEENNIVVVRPGAAWIGWPGLGAPWSGLDRLAQVGPGLASGGVAS
jgi:hypothetical protein